MDWLIVITVFAGVAAIGSFLYLLFIGQKSIPEWLREKKQGGHRNRVGVIRSEIQPSENINHRKPANDEQMLAVMKVTPSPGLNLTTKRMPAIGPKDILVRVSAASICGTDLAIYE